MKKLFFKYRFLTLAFILAATVVVLANLPYARAEVDDLAVKFEYDTSSLYEYQGELYLSSSAAPNATMKYSITNNTDETVKFSAVRVMETLLGAGYSYGNKTYDEVITLEPGEVYEFEGENFVFDSSDDYTFQYNVLVVYYSEDEFGEQNSYTERDFESLVSGDGIKFITKEKISFETSYDYWMMQENIHAGDVITIEFVLTSSSNVPVRNIMLYDTVFGYMGSIDEIKPGETKYISAQVTVEESTVSYPYITYTSYGDAENIDQIDFTDNRIIINITAHNYVLGMEIQCDNVYVSNGSQVILNFIISNLGSGDVTNIAVLDEWNTTLFTVDILEAGEIYTKTVEVSCNPDTTYRFRCISPSTEAVDTSITFLSMPGVDIKYYLDKEISEYKFGDTVKITYVIINDGSVTAENLILTDTGLGMTWTIGIMEAGEERTIEYTFELDSAQTVISPNLTGNYVDYDSGEIDEHPAVTAIDVDLPDTHADVDMTWSISPDKIYEGDTISILFDLRNIGTGNLRSYTVTILEKNMIIASEGRLEAGQNKNFSAQFVCSKSQTITVRIEGRNEDTDEVYVKDFTIEIVAEQREAVTPTPGATETNPPPTPTDNGGKTDPDNVSILMFVIVLIVGIITLALLFITIYILVKSLIKRMKNR